MFLQRLVSDKDVGFNYDYMGNAHFEFGATRYGRMALAQAFLDGKLTTKRTNFISQWGVSTSKPEDVVILGLKDGFAGKIGPTMSIAASAENPRVDNKKIVAWMHVGREEVEPLLIIRTSVVDLGQRVEKFLFDFVEYETGHRAAVAALDYDDTKSEPWKAGWKEFVQALAEDQ